MPARYVAAFTLGLIAIFGWNAFLIQRDDRMFKAYYHQKAKVEQQKLIKSAYQTHKQH